MSLAHTASDGFADLHERFAAHGQDHVFRFWGDLAPEGRQRLALQAARIDLASLARARTVALSRAGPGPRGLAPAPVECLPERGSDPTWRGPARERGEALLAAGRVGALVVAGGQATRLGSPEPKGALPLGPVSGRTLFGLQAQKLRGLARRYGRAVPWYVMTSPATDAATRALFARQDHFGIEPGDVFFLCQRTLPALDFEGRLILEAADRIAEAPEGHGGAIPALHVSGALTDMRARGIQTISYYQVDNPLVRIADPLLMGLHALRGAEMTCKVVRKAGPDERVGTLARAGGRLHVVEYTELREPLRSQRDASGALAFWAGAIGVHALDVAFVDRVARSAETALPLHASAKRIPAVDRLGRPEVPVEPNGIKLERFVFDALPLARAATALEVRREEEYSPIKNASGGESPATGRRDLVACVRRWLQASGVPLPPPSVALEVDHASIDGPDDARALGIGRIEEAPTVILTGTGEIG